MEEKGVVSKANRDRCIVVLKLSRAIIFFFIFTLYKLNIRKTIVINKLNGIDNIQFEFTQKANEKIEEGNVLFFQAS